jgi:hypothetical protein
MDNKNKEKIICITRKKGAKIDFGHKCPVS